VAANAWFRYDEKDRCSGDAQASLGSSPWRETLAIVTSPAVPPMTAGTATGGEAVRKILYVTLTLLVALTATLTQPKAEATTNDCRWQCGLCGLVCPCKVCYGPLPVCPCG
jgi:hypothetical protein